MPAITAKQNNYLPLDEPSVGYDRSGTAYIAGVYFNVEGSEARVSSPSKNQQMEPIGASQSWRCVTQARPIRSRPG